MSVRLKPLVGNWRPGESDRLADILRPIPAALLEDNPWVQTFERRDVLRNAPPSAPGHSLYDPKLRSIVLFDKAMTSKEQFARSVYHELAHAILKNEPSLLSKWQKQTAPNEFVDEYAKTSPEEDFCDSFSEMMINQRAAEKVAPTKTRFAAEVIEGVREKTAMAFIDGFADELLKTGAPGMLSRLAEKAPTIARGAAIAGGAGLVGHALGKHKGERQGVEEGASMAGDMAQRAYRVGVQRGAAAMRDALSEQMEHGKAER